MSKRKKRQGLPIGGSFTPLLHDVQNSEAYQDLSGNAAKLYGYILRVARTVAVKSGAVSEMAVQFNYTYSEAKKRGFAESTFKRALKDLWSKGFITVVSIGGRTTSEAYGRVPSLYSLTVTWKSYGKGGGKWLERSKHEPDPWLIPSEPPRRA